MKKNADTAMYPASLTKIATAIYVIETADLDDMVTVSGNARDTEGTSVFLEEGEQVSLKKLVQGLLINSGNDAGVAIAEHVGGSVGQFTSELNGYLQQKVGVQNTHFENPHGLFDSGHVTTAQDLAAITRYAIQNETFREIFGTVELAWDGESWDTTLLTHHKLMRERPYDGITGGKTGFVNQSGFTLATTAKRDDLNLIVITLNANMQKDAYQDTINLLDYGFGRFTHSTIAKGMTFETDDTEYKTTQPLTITHKTDGELQKDVSEEGVLKVRKRKGEVVDTFQLEKTKQDRRSETAKSDVKKNSVLGSSALMAVVSIVVVMIGIIGVLYRRKRKREERFFW
ncbi:D-alanyl-D-alanine carboxypeptidase family protein [Lentibacillus salicampi]|nr:D-alanyl-D-alanine carboxypeptidase family protein [Lentibacillus salicampi]